MVRLFIACLAMLFTLGATEASAAKITLKRGIYSESRAGCTALKQFEQFHETYRTE